MSGSNELRVKRLWLSIDSGFKWFGCQLFWDSSELVVSCLEIQVIWLSIDLRFKAFLRDFFKIETLNLKNIAFLRDFLQNEALKLKNEAFPRDFLQNWSFEAQKRSISARLPSKIKLWRSKAKHFCETSFRNATLKLKIKALVKGISDTFAVQSMMSNQNRPRWVFCSHAAWRAV